MHIQYALWIAEDSGHIELAVEKLLSWSWMANEMDDPVQVISEEF
ncbi:MAG: hypothetical protein O3B01_16850 [Planctomycetota bacterium]|nr:hypothetical protein [Planctomycetota bacterium]